MENMSPALPKKGDLMVAKSLSNTGGNNKVNLSEAATIIGSLIKSRTLVYVFAVTSLVTFLTASPGIPDISIAIRLAASSYLVALATYLYNDLTDFKVDEINNRRTERDNSRTKYLVTLYSTIGLFAVSISMAFSINLVTGLGSLAFTALAIVYSHPRTHLKNKFLLKTVTTSAGAVIVSLMGISAAESYSYSAFASSAIVLMFYFVLGPMGDIGDIRGDKAGGRRTIPIVIGVGKTFALIIAAIVTMGGVALGAYYFLDLHVSGAIVAVIACGIAIFQIKRISKDYGNKIKIKQTRTILRYSVLTVQVSVLIGSATAYALSALV